MAAKQMMFETAARQEIAEGLVQLAKAVKATLGPRGRNVVLQKSYGSPRITKDGVTVAKEIELQDPFENMGAKLVQTVASKTLTAASAITAFTPLPLSGGTLPFAYTVSPALPTGLSLNPTTGAITGTAAAATASAVYTVTATDAAGASATQALTLLVNPALVATQAVATKILLVNTVATAFTR